MSTTFYGYRIKKDVFWNEIEKIKTFYSNNHMAKKVIDSYLTELFPPGIDSSSVLRIMRQNRGKIEQEIEELHSEIFLEIYDYNAEEYIIDVLENGYLFMNSYQKEEWDLREFYYDDRGEFPEELEHEKEERKLVAEITEGKRMAKQYFLCPIYTKEDWYEYLLSECRKFG